MTNSDAMARWGIPDWSNAAAFPQQATDSDWRWEFLRRRPDYRNAWERWQDSVMEQGGILTALTDDAQMARLRFGVSVIYDPRHRFDDWTAWQIFLHAHGHAHFPSSAGPLHLGPVSFRTEAELENEIQRRSAIDNAYKDAGIIDYRFSLGKPLEPQLAQARNHLLKIQAELHGKKNTPRPSRELWPLYLRALDARDCGASWERIGKAFWPSDKGKVKDKARRAHDRAIEVRDNFPI